MPGFFDAMKRIAQGKPVFDANDQPNAPAISGAPVAGHSAGEQHESLIRKGSDRTFPVVYVKHTNVHMNGPTMQVYCRILNTWPEPIELDKIRILDRTHELDAPLRPNEEREFLVYNGPRPRNKITHAQLDYKTHHERDYFEAIHDVTFRYHDEDRSYSVDEVKLRLPIRDIYG
jgi:hypothetical protein